MSPLYTLLLNRDALRYHRLRIYRKRSGAMPERKGHAFEEHWQILRALQRRDGQLAESLMRAHIGRANDALLNAHSAGVPQARKDS